METTNDQRVAAVASQAYGLIAREQALECGITHAQIEARLRSGRWVQVVRGVYRIAGVPRSWRQSTLAACLAPGGAVGSYLTGAALVRIAPPPTRAHVTVGIRQSARLPIARVHRTRLDPLDVTSVDGIPVTTVERTLVDCADLLGSASLQRLVDNAFHAQLLTVAALEETAERAGRRRGKRRLLPLLAAWRAAIPPASAPEARLLRLVESWGYPTPECQVVIEQADGDFIARADIGWPERRLAVEYDSSAFHGPDAWDHDEHRHVRVTANGWTLLHADKADLMPGERALRDHLARMWKRTEPAALPR